MATRGFMARVDYGENSHPCTDEQEMDPIITKIKSLYEAGVPLYTKPLLLSLSEQMNRVKQGLQKTILVRRIDGLYLEFDMDNTTVEGVCAPLVIKYRNIQGMTDIKNPGYNSNPGTAFSPIGMSQYLFLHDKQTGKIIMPEPEPPLSPLKIQKGLVMFAATQAKWETFAACVKLRSTLSSIQIPHEIKKIVAFGLGPMSFFSTNLGYHYSRECRAMYQHALMLTLRDVLAAKKGSGVISTFAQDPKYEALDRMCLNRAKVTILEDPKGFLEVDDATLVLSISVHAPVKQIISDIARPAMIIWEQLGLADDFHDLIDADSPRLTHMIRSEYNEYKIMRDHDSEHRFRLLALYVRKPDTSTKN